MISAKKPIFFLPFTAYGFLFLLVFCPFLFSYEIYASKGPCVRMYYFYSSGCEECLRIKNSYIPDLNKKYGFCLNVKYFEVNEPENYKLLLELEKKIHPLKNPLPAVFVENHVLDGDEEIKDGLERLIKYYVSKGGCDWPAAGERGIKQVDNLALERFKSLGILAIISGGLLDGLNPCAFTTIIFLISYLVFIGRKGREIIFIGGAFTCAVFITYFLIGLGLFEFTVKMAVFPLLGRVVSLLIACMAVVLGILSLYDYYKIKEGKIEAIALQLPQSLKNKIHSAIRKESKTKHFILGSLCLGFLIALLEFPCTGQVYLPVIFVLRRISEFRPRALFYLALYNIMFILPLIAVFIFALKGASSQIFAQLMKKNAGTIKVFTAILFFALAAILIVWL